MKCGHKCSRNKLLMGIPAVFAVALIIYISVIFLYRFVPYSFPTYTAGRITLEIVFYYYSTMTLVSIVTCALSDPGYLSMEY